MPTLNGSVAKGDTLDFTPAPLPKTRNARGEAPFQMWVDPALIERAEEVSRRLKMPRGRVAAKALAEFLERDQLANAAA
jgi:hypothetical protein